MMNSRLLYHILVLVLALAICASASSASGQEDTPGSGDVSVLPASQIVPAPLINIRAVEAAGNQTCAVTATNGVLCWGDNEYGQLGNDSTLDHLNPVDVVGLSSNVSALATGYYHVCALTTNGGVKCWGDNFHGELGDDSTTERHTPVNVEGLASGVIAISVGGSHSCAVTAGGGVKCWGDNSNGQLGDGTIIERHTPVNVVGLGSGVIAIATGYYHTCALTSGGVVKCWGDNFYGEVGDDSTTERHTPVKVKGLTAKATAISAGGFHTCALTEFGGVKCWGRNDSGQLGDSSTTERHMPVDVTGLDSGIVAVSVGSYHTCAVTSSSGGKCWGNNFNGALGDNSTTDRPSPVDISGLANDVNDIAAGIDHTCALLPGGQVKCWGYNADGQLGDGTKIGRSIPGNVITSLPCYKLLRDHSGTGTDPVASPDHTPGCPANHYLRGENIALFANADNGWRVNGWSGTKNNASLADVNSLTMPNRDATASVAYARCRVLTCTHDGQGGDPVPAPAHSLNCAAGTYVEGETIALIAKPNANQRVKGWSGTDTTPDAGVLVNTLTMPASTRTVKATYEACNLLTAQVSGQGEPLTAVPVASVGCPAGRYAPGQSIVLTAAPASGWMVDAWSGTADDESSAATNSVTMPDGDHTVGVTYMKLEETESLYLPALQR